MRRTHNKCRKNCMHIQDVLLYSTSALQVALRDTFARSDIFSLILGNQFDCTRLWLEKAGGLPCLIRKCSSSAKKSNIAIFFLLIPEREVINRESILVLCNRCQEDHLHFNRRAQYVPCKIVTQNNVQWLLLAYSDLSGEWN